MKIDLAVLNRQYQLYKVEYDEAIFRVLNSGWYVLGNEGTLFEQEYATYMKSQYCVGLNSGLDALILAVRSLDIGEQDEVIVPSNTYIATVLGITENKATPVFVEPDEFYNLDVEKIENAITSKTKAIIVVHLYGQAANMKKIKELADKYNLYLIEDCAQAHGTCFDKKYVGTFGDIGCFSFFPTKNLGAFGDAGAIITNNKSIYDKVIMLRNYGSKIKYYNEIEGINSRLDEIQAALLRVKLRHLNELNYERKSIAKAYFSGITNRQIQLPETQEKSEHVYHQFVVRLKNRDQFKKYLEEKGIQTIIHYPIPPHLAECYQRLGYKKNDFPIAERYADEVLSLPIYNGMTVTEIDYVIDVINNFLFD